MQSEHKKISRLDMLGFSASTICAIHCAIVPVALLFLPLIGLEFLTNPVIEITLIGLSLFIGIYTLRSGYRKHHGRIYPTVLFILGLAIITIGHFAGGHDEGHSMLDGHSHSLETNGIIALMVIPIGAVLIAIAHYMNRKMCLSCTVDHKHNEPGPHEHLSGHDHSHDHSHIHHHHEKNQRQEPADAL